MTFPTQSAPGGRQLHDMRFNVFNFFNSSLATVTNGFVDVFTITGKGIVNDFITNISGPVANIINPVIRIDGVEYSLSSVSGGTANRSWISSSINLGSTSNLMSGIKLNTPIKFKSEFTLRLNNVTGTSQSVGIAAHIIYYT